MSKLRLILKTLQLACNYLRRGVVIILPLCAMRSNKRTDTCLCTHTKGVDEDQRSLCHGR